VGTRFPLVIAAHGSADPGFTHVVDSLASLVGGLRPGLDVRTGYLEHGTDLASVADGDCVVVPLLLTGGFHARADIPARVDGVVTQPVGPDHRLTVVLELRLRESGWRGERPLVLAAAGSSDQRALADVHQTARDLGDLLGLDVPAGFISSGDPLLCDLEARAVATYLLAPGRFADAVDRCGADIVAAPLGAHPLIAEIVLDRYDAAPPFNAI
jgi:sirohydrochlorin ferrochelatase